MLHFLNWSCEIYKWCGDYELDTVCGYKSWVVVHCLIVVLMAKIYASRGSCRK